MAEFTKKVAGHCGMWQTLCGSSVLCLHHMAWQQQYKQQFDCLWHEHVCFLRFVYRYLYCSTCQDTGVYHEVFDQIVKDLLGTLQQSIEPLLGRSTGGLNSTVQIINSNAPSDSSRF